MSFPDPHSPLAPTAPSVQYLVIVERAEPALYDYLRRRFADDPLV